MSEKEKRKKIEVEAAEPEALPEPQDDVQQQAAAEAADATAAEPVGSQGEVQEAKEEAQREIERLRAEVEEYKDKYLRALAELENYRRRMEEERVRQMQYANEKLLRELLPIVDDLERALASEGASAEALRKGVEMILGKLRQTLEAFGVEVMETVGETFDPYLHEAVDRVVTAEVPEGTIVSELQRGYKYRERLLRPARVTVAVAPQEQDSEKGEGDQQES